MDDIRGRQMGMAVAETTTAFWNDLVHLPGEAEVIPGCMYDIATNYDPQATQDNGSCTFSDCKDFDGDGLVSTGDLLAVLGDFNTTCD